MRHEIINHYVNQRISTKKLLIISQFNNEEKITKLMTHRIFSNKFSCVNKTTLI